MVIAQTAAEDLARAAPPRASCGRLRQLRGTGSAPRASASAARRTRCRRGPRGRTCRARPWRRRPRPGTSSTSRRWPGTPARSWRPPCATPRRGPRRPARAPSSSRSRSKVRARRQRVGRSSMRSSRASWRRSTPSCLRTSMLVADGPAGEVLRGTRIISCADLGPGPAAREQFAQREHVDSGLDRGGGHLRRVGLPVDHRERLDLDHVERCRHAGTRPGPAPGRRAGRRPGAQQRMVEHGAGAPGAAGQQPAGFGRAAARCRSPADLVEVGVARRGDARPSLSRSSVSSSPRRWPLPGPQRSCPG